MFDQWGEPGITTLKVRIRRAICFWFCSHWYWLPDSLTCWGSLAFYEPWTSEECAGDPLP